MKHKFIKNLLWKCCQHKDIINITTSTDQLSCLTFGDSDNILDTYLIHYDEGRSQSKIYERSNNLLFKVKRSLKNKEIEEHECISGTLFLKEDEINNCEIRWISENNWSLIFPSCTITKYKRTND